MAVLPSELSPQPMTTPSPFKPSLCVSPAAIATRLVAFAGTVDTVPRGIATALRVRRRALLLSPHATIVPAAWLLATASQDTDIRAKMRFVRLAKERVTPTVGDDFFAAEIEPMVLLFTA